MFIKVVTSEKIVMKEELEYTFRFKKLTLLFNNGKNRVTQKSKGGLLKSAKKKKSCKSFDLQDSVAEREGGWVL